jgi:hypothetical protein
VRRVRLVEGRVRLVEGRVRLVEGRVRLVEGRVRLVEARWAEGAGSLSGGCGSFGRWSRLVMRRVRLVRNVKARNVKTRSRAGARVEVALAESGD